MPFSSTRRNMMNRGNSFRICNLGLSGSDCFHRQYLSHQYSSSKVLTPLTALLLLRCSYCAAPSGHDTSLYPSCLNRRVFVAASDCSPLRPRLPACLLCLSRWGIYRLCLPSSLLLLSCCFLVASLLLPCCFLVASLLLLCCFFVASLLLPFANIARDCFAIPLLAALV
jgi:hypothetical protein